MIRALGVSETPFDPFDPGRLCRGRERWVDPWECDPPHPSVQRLIISGAAFDDDSARDARRGVAFSGIRLAKLLAALFPGKTLIAFMEDGHPADIPEGADGVEAYSGHRAGGRGHEPMVRWTHVLDDASALAASIDVPSFEGTASAEELGLAPEFGPDLVASERVRGFVVADAMTPALAEKLFLFVGMSTLDSPPARFQPGALPEILRDVPAIIALHRDKHGPVIGVYSREPIGANERIAALCAEVGALLVPFAIPPMLARWDRALSDLRRTWNEATQGPFPVPANTNPNLWDRRRRRGRDEGPPLAEEPVSSPLDDLLDVESGEPSEPEDDEADGPDDEADGPDDEADDGPDEAPDDAP